MSDKPEKIDFASVVLPPLAEPANTFCDAARLPPGVEQITGTVSGILYKGCGPSAGHDIVEHPDSSETHEWDV